MSAADAADAENRFCVVGAFAGNGKDSMARVRVWRKMHTWQANCDFAKKCKEETVELHVLTASHCPGD
jgi:hypothetical protein